jgi:2,3-dihydroxybenzoate-AMP ligase
MGRLTRYKQETLAARRATSMTAAHIAFHAAERPDAIALVNNGDAITYARFNRDVGAMTSALREFRLPRGAAVAIGCEDVYFHWLLLLGADRLGIATASLVGQEDRGSQPLLASMDLVLSEQPFGADLARRHHPIDRAWLERALAREPDREATSVPRGPDDVIRVIRTSGTTGDSKRVRQLRRIFDPWVDVWIWFYGLTNRTRFLLTLPFTVGGCYAHATACLRAGGTVVSETRTGFAEALSSYGITHVILMPNQLGKLLDELPADYSKPADLTISSFGAPVTATLRERAIDRLAHAVTDMYGCNEVGFIATTSMHSRDGLASIWPGVEVEIVDESDRPLPLGQAGRIRVKTDWMASSYVDDPESTSRMFRDGWFYPGDAGVLHGPRSLDIIGRGDELLNLGGRKFAPIAVEDLLMRNGVGRDVAVCTIPNSDGIEELCIALPTGAAKDTALQERIEQALNQWHIPTFYLFTLDRIPRTVTGKVQRNLLKEAIAQARAIQVDAGAKS